MIDLVAFISSNLLLVRRGWIDRCSLAVLDKTRLDMAAPSPNAKCVRQTERDVYCTYSIRPRQEYLLRKALSIVRPKSVLDEHNSRIAWLFSSVEYRAAFFE